MCLYKTKETTITINSSISVNFRITLMRVWVSLGSRPEGQTQGLIRNSDHAENAIDGLLVETLHFEMGSTLTQKRM